jgi:hypothetical protein
LKKATDLLYTYYFNFNFFVCDIIMSTSADKALLPTGMADVLPPDAAFEAYVIEQLMGMIG